MRFIPFAAVSGKASDAARVSTGQAKSTLPYIGLTNLA